MRRLILLNMTVIPVLLGFIDRPAAQQPGKSPLKVFVLAGQSNMQGAGAVTANPNRNGGRGSLQYLVNSSPEKERFRTARITASRRLPSASHVAGGAGRSANGPTRLRFDGMSGQGTCPAWMRPVPPRF